ncbi:NUDIX domain-containing protein [Citricoccus sp. GCM10030269]|uniref:NUDIX hydrolase n=1 Tax=Citricoccus sp. GCM10030269 TaxID=3273388 RepID=UPI00360F46D7
MTRTAMDGAGTAGKICVSAVVLHRADGLVLTVRKAGTTMFMFPGGKHELDEQPLDTAIRELAEETGLAVPPEDLQHLGAWDTPAANEDGFELHSEVFALVRPLASQQVPSATAEIEELVWMDPADPVAPGGHGIAPLLMAVFPELQRHRRV